MKPILPLPLIAVTLLFTACSSFKPPQPLASAAREPLLAGNQVTTWGELPSYEKQGHYFKVWNSRPARDSALNGHAVVDVLVNADGTVRDAAIFTTSGDPAVDALALKMYKASRYSLRLTPGQPAPHVVRQEFYVRTAARPSPHYIDATNYGSLGPNVTSDLQSPPKVQ